MSNEQLALLLDPRREKPGWWRDRCPSCGILGNPKANTMDHHDDCLGGAPYGVFTGPDWHASDDACFRDWRPVLLAAGCYITEEKNFGCTVYWRKGQACISDMVNIQTYRAAILAAIEELHTTKPELLREAIARVNKGE